MLTLGVETATPWGSLALAEDETLIMEVSLKLPKGGGEYLLAVLEPLLAKTGYPLTQINRLVVGTGPGSYTGIRVGIAAAKGMAAGLKIPVLGLSTLRIIAENARYGAKWIAVALDARRGEVYGALYENQTAGLVPAEAPRVMTVGDLTDMLAKKRDVVLCGDAGKRYPEIRAQIPQCRIAPSSWDRPLAGQAALLVNREGDTVPNEAGALVPSYLRRVEAEIRLEEKLHGSQGCTDVCGRFGRGARD